MRSTQLKPYRTACIILSIILVSVFSSCSKHTIKSSWLNDEYQDTKLTDILIFGLTNDPQERTLFEGAFVAEFREAGVRTKASFSIQREPVEPTREAVLAVVGKSGAKYVLLTQLAEYNQETVEQFAVDRIPEAHEDQTIAGFYESFEPTTSVTLSKSILQTYLYDAKSETLIWKSVSEAKNAEMTNKYMRGVAKVLIKQLRKDELI